MNSPDERDTLFSRMELEPGTPNYEAYYAKHPQRKTVDDRLRAMAGQFPDQQALRRLTDASFQLLEDLRPLTRGRVRSEKLQIAPEEATALLKKCAESYGAVLFGTAVLGDACFYSTYGRGAEYGMPVRVPGRQGIVFAVRMDPEEIAKAPSPREAVEVVNGYLRVALIGLALSYCIRGWGWEAACTLDGRADLVLPIAARFAGLGSIGRSGLLLTEEYGPCIRLGAVVTDLPLARTARRALRAPLLCETCNACARACPAGAIDSSLEGEFRVRPVNDDACYLYWRQVGTDCGLCIAHCPLSRIHSR